MGSAMWRTVLGGRARLERVSEGAERCLPAWTRRRSVSGRLWRRASRVERVDIEVEEGRLSGIAGSKGQYGVVLGWVWVLRLAESVVPRLGTRQARGSRDVLDVPETFLTKICMVSSSEAWELMLEMLLERRIMAWGVVGEVGTARGAWSVEREAWRRELSLDAGVDVAGCR